MELLKEFQKTLYKQGKKLYNIIVRNPLTVYRIFIKRGRNHEQRHEPRHIH